MAKKDNAKNKKQAKIPIQLWKQWSFLNYTNISVNEVLTVSGDRLVPKIKGYLLFTFLKKKKNLLNVKTAYYCRKLVNFQKSITKGIKIIHNSNILK